MQKMKKNLYEEQLKQEHLERFKNRTEEETNALYEEAMAYAKEHYRDFGKEVPPIDESKTEEEIDREIEEMRKKALENRKRFKLIFRES